MRMLISAILALTLPFAAVGSATPEPMAEQPTVRAKSCVLMGYDGDILFEHDADLLLPIASTTKLMTALVLVESCDLDEPVDILPVHCRVIGSSMYLKPGESYTVRELLTGLLLASGNDAALALADHCAGSEASFVALMNSRAAELGLRHTHFMNPHGLHEPNHYSTAIDLGLLMRAVMDQPSLADILSQENVILHGQLFVNHNKLLSRYKGCIGGKTGYTEAAGRCLVSCAERRGTRLICVTLSDPDDWNDHEALYDWGFEHFETRILASAEQPYDIPLLSGAEAYARAVPSAEAAVLLPKTAVLRYRVELPFYVFAPVRSGSAAGRLLVYEGDRLLAEIPLMYLRDYPVQ